MAAPALLKSQVDGSEPASKLLELDQLASTLRRLKAAGDTIVHCHGVFDLLHPGHIRHLKAAREMGDVLVVTITPDRYVNKGPHRPAFTEKLRAEVLAALDAVDYVAINRWPTATETIQLLRPDVYAKGEDYRDSSGDVTGGIVTEAGAVAAVGGEIRFTQDITFSSSALINRHVSPFSPEVDTYLDAFRASYSFCDLKQELASLAEMTVTVVGEAILDEYVYCSALNKSGKEPILAMRYLSREMYAGGSLAIANHLAAFCKEVRLVAYVGSSDSREDFIRARLKPNVIPRFIVKADSPTILKRRYVDNYYLSKLFEVYEINDEPLGDEDERQLRLALEETVAGCDATIVADFGHGLITPGAVQLLEEQAGFLAVNTQINAANMGFHTISKYPRADYVCIQESELRLDSRDRRQELSSLIARLAAQLRCPRLMVTRGSHGTMLYQQGSGFLETPSLALNVVDRIGAGDAVFALTTLCAAQGMAPELIGFVANMVGAQAVSIVGNRSSVDRVGLLKSMEAILK